MEQENKIVWWIQEIWLLKEHLFYNVTIKKPYIERFNNIDVLHELSFYNELISVKISKAFRRYARSYSIEIIDSKDPSVQFTVSKPSIEDLFENLWIEIKVWNIK